MDPPPPKSAKVRINNDLAPDFGSGLITGGAREWRVWPREPWTVGVPSGRARRLRVRAPQAFAEGISSDGQTLLIDEVSVGQHASSGRVVRIPFAGGPAKVLIAHGAQSSWDG